MSIAVSSVGPFYGWNLCISPSQSCYHFIGHFVSPEAKENWKPLHQLRYCDICQDVQLLDCAASEPIDPSMVVYGVNLPVRVAPGTVSVSLSYVTSDTLSPTTSSLGPSHVMPAHSGLRLWLAWRVLPTKSTVINLGVSANAEAWPDRFKRKFMHDRKD